MAKDFMTVLELTPETDDPQQEAIDLTNDFKNCVQQIAAAQSIRQRCFDDYLDHAVKAPRKPSERSARADAKKMNGLHFWSSWGPWLKKQLRGDETDYKKYLEQKKQMEDDRDFIYRQDCARYDRELSEHRETLSKMIAEFHHQDKELVEAYFTFVLTSDQFSIDFFHEYDVAVRSLQYDADDHSLSVHYRIPAKGEILPLDYFYFDDEYQVIRDRQLSSGIAVDYRNDIARRVLLRVAASLFMSDELDMIDTIELHGYLDDNSTDGRIITVIRLIFPRNEIIGKAPEFISTKFDFIEKFQEERSPDLYKVESYQLRELLIHPRISKRTNGTASNQNDRANKRQ